jgi:hypothetical protein
MSLATTPSKRGKQVVMVVVYPENLVVRVTQAKLVDLVVPEHLDHLDSLVVHHESVTNQPNHHADNAHLEKQETLDPVENLEVPDVLAILADLETMDHQDNLVHQDHLDPVETLVEMDHLDNLAAQLRANL